MTTKTDLFSAAFHANHSSTDSFGFDESDGDCTWASAQISVAQDLANQLSQKLNPVKPKVHRIDDDDDESWFSEASDAEGDVASVSSKASLGKSKQQRRKQRPKKAKGSFNKSPSHLGDESSLLHNGLRKDATARGNDDDSIEENLFGFSSNMNAFEATFGNVAVDQSATNVNLSNPNDHATECSTSFFSEASAALDVSVDKTTGFPANWSSTIASIGTVPSSSLENKFSVSEIISDTSAHSKKIEEPKRATLTMVPSKGLGSPTYHVPTVSLFSAPAISSSAGAELAKRRQAWLKEIRSIRRKPSSYSTDDDNQNNVGTEVNQDAKDESRVPKSPRMTADKKKYKSVMSAVAAKAAAMASKTSDQMEKLSVHSIQSDEGNRNAMGATMYIQSLDPLSASDHGPRRPNHLVKRQKRSPLSQQDSSLSNGLNGSATSLNTERRGQGKVVNKVVKGTGISSATGVGPITQGSGSPRRHVLKSRSNSMSGEVSDEAGSGETKSVSRPVRRSTISNTVKSNEVTTLPSQLDQGRKKVIVRRRSGDGSSSDRAATSTTSNATKAASGQKIRRVVKATENISQVTNTKRNKALLQAELKEKSRPKSPVRSGNTGNAQRPLSQQAQSKYVSGPATAESAVAERKARPRLARKQLPSPSTLVALTPATDATSNSSNDGTGTLPESLSNTRNLRNQCSIGSMKDTPGSGKQQKGRVLKKQGSARSLNDALDSELEEVSKPKRIIRKQGSVRSLNDALDQEEEPKPRPKHIIRRQARGLQKTTSSRTDIKGSNQNISESMSTGIASGSPAPCDLMNPDSEEGNLGDDLNKRQISRVPVGRLERHMMSRRPEKTAALSGAVSLADHELKSRKAMQCDPTDICSLPGGNSTEAASVSGDQVTRRRVVKRSVTRTGGKSSGDEAPSPTKPLRRTGTTTTTERSRLVNVAVSNNHDSAPALDCNSSGSLKPRLVKSSSASHVDPILLHKESPRRNSPRRVPIQRKHNIKNDDPAQCAEENSNQHSRQRIPMQRKESKHDDSAPPLEEHPRLHSPQRIPIKSKQSKHESLQDNSRQQNPRRVPVQIKQNQGLVGPKQVPVRLKRQTSK